MTADLSPSSLRYVSPARSILRSFGLALLLLCPARAQAITFDVGNCIQHDPGDNHCQAHRVWLDTGLTVQKGQIVKISATASWTWGAGVQAHFGPDGVSCTSPACSNADRFSAGAKLGALIGYVGATGLTQKNFGTPAHGGTIGQNDQRYFKIGSGVNIASAQYAGRLYLGFNDDYTTVGQSPPGAFDGTIDNDGSATVTIESICGNGTKEPAEQCDGGPCCSSTCQFKPSTTVCRAAAGVCDLPEMCTGSSASCPADAFKAAGTECRASTDPECDPSESCTGASPSCPTDVSSCCGDGKVVPPEECDLGSGNCDPSQCCGCSTDCKLIGHCSVSGGCCETASDCPPNEGCCGNHVVEGNEQCDDGNNLDGDCCSNTCQTESSTSCTPSLCAELGIFGPHVLPATERLTLTDAKLDGVMEKWTKTGEFVLFSGQSVDPADERVVVAISENNGSNGRTELHRVDLESTACGVSQTCFVPNKLKTSWRYRDDIRAADPPNACGFQTGSIKRSSGNKIKFQLKGKSDAADACTYSFPRPGGTILREDVVIGDECATVLLDCRIFGGNKSYRCVPRP